MAMRPIVEHTGRGYRSATPPSTRAFGHGEETRTSGNEFSLWSCRATLACTRCNAAPQRQRQSVRAALPSGPGSTPRGAGIRDDCNLLKTNKPKTAFSAQGRGGTAWKHVSSVLPAVAPAHTEGPQWALPPVHARPVEVARSAGSSMNARLSVYLASTRLRDWSHYCIAGLRQ